MNTLVNTANVIEDIRPYNLNYSCQVFYLWWASRYHRRWIRLGTLVDDYQVCRRQVLRYIQSLTKEDMIERRLTYGAAKQEYRIK